MESNKGSKRALPVLEGLFLMIWPTAHLHRLVDEVDTCVFDSVRNRIWSGPAFSLGLALAHIELNIDGHALTVSRPVQHKRVKRMRCKKDGRTEQTDASADAAVAGVVADAV